MFCPPDVNTGFIQLVGPILQQDLNSITVKSYPLSISFAPRTTVPTLIGNRIDESTENTCTFKGQRFSLVDVQICSVTNQGYILPGQTERPVAELILSFSANQQAQSLASLSGILLCVPIYDTGAPSHGDYINQLIDSAVPSCNYTHLVGSDYTGGDYQQLQNQSLLSCINACCADSNCLAYTFNSGTCYMKNSIPTLNNTGDMKSVTGTVNQNVPNAVGTTSPTCPTQPPANSKNGQDDQQSGVPNLQTIFYGWKGDNTQKSLAYKTCFETLDSNNNPISRSLYIVVFPNGIHLTQAGFQQIVLQLNGNIPSYMIPPAIRGGDVTLRSYNFDDEGNKVPTITSQDGIIYSTPLSSCTDEFRHRFEYFTLPPRLPITSGVVPDKCSYYTTKQYKCVPFNQLKDLSTDGNNYVIPGNNTLADILAEQKNATKKELSVQMGTPSEMTVQEMEVIGGTVAAVVVLGVAGLLISKFVTKVL
jgi:hypothetical protein